MSSGVAKVVRKGGVAHSTSQYEESLRKGYKGDRPAVVGGAANVDSGSRAKAARANHHGDEATAKSKKPGPAKKADHGA